MEINILSWIIWVPLLGMALIAFVPRGKTQLIKIITALTTGVQFLVTLVLWSQFDLTNGGFQFMERATWIP